MHCCGYTFGKVCFQVSRYWVGVEVIGFKYNWVLDENEIQESYLNWGAEVIVSFPCTFSRTRYLVPVYTTACTEILTDSARVYTFLNSLPSIWYVPCILWGQGMGSPFYLTWWEPGTDTLFKLNYSCIPRKAIIENWKSFSSNSAARWGPVKRFTSGAENILSAGTRWARED